MNHRKHTHKKKHLLINKTSEVVVVVVVVVDGDINECCVPADSSTQTKFH